jgi:C1A family cysteine protease
MAKTVQTPEHGEKGLGWRPDTPDHRDFIYNDRREVMAADSLPDVFSLRSKMPPVWDQLELGSCVPHGTGALEVAERMKQGGSSHTPSRLFIYYNGRVLEHTVGEDSGLEVRDGIKTIAQQGAPPETDWAYDISKFTEKPPNKAYTDAVKLEALIYMRVLPGGRGSPIRTPVSKGYPVTFGFTVPDRFESASWNPATQYLPLPKAHEASIGGHCVDVIGWDFSLKRFAVPVFEIRNSWGKAWGDAGHFFMDARWLYEPRLDLSSDFWIIEKVS